MNICVYLFINLFIIDGEYDTSDMRIPDKRIIDEYCQVCFQTIIGKLSTLILYNILHNVLVHKFLAYWI